MGSINMFDSRKSSVTIVKHQNTYGAVGKISTGNSRNHDKIGLSPKLGKGKKLKNATMATMQPKLGISRNIHKYLTGGSGSMTSIKKSSLAKKI